MDPGLEVDMGMTSREALPQPGVKLLEMLGMQCVKIPTKLLGFKLKRLEMRGEKKA
jgi:hypothetical protein